MPYLKQVTPCPEPLDCRILTAALELFVDKGYHKVSIHEIQKQADVSIGSIYNHFGSKEGVARALYRHLLNELNELIDDITQQKGTPAEQCWELIRRLFSHTETHRSIIAFLFHTKHAEFLPDEPGIRESAPFLRLQGLIDSGIRQGDFPAANPLVISALVFGGAIDLIQRRLENSIEKPLPGLAEDFIRSLRTGLSPAGRKLPRAATQCQLA